MTNDLDFDDALVVACMVENNIEKLVSFDEHFDKVKEVEKIEPKDAIDSAKKLNL